jgi:DNA-binding PadR family transcriptional regulator
MHGRGRHFFFAQGPFGGGSPFGGPPGDVFFGGRRGPRRGRGDVRSAILLLLAEEPRNGYQIMQELEQRSGGTWRPSPGSVYPALQLLADEGLVTSEARGGGNIFELTDAGRAHVADQHEQAPPPWEAVNAGATQEMIELRGQLIQIADAARQVARSGNDAHLAAATKLLAETRRSLYGILAGD